MSALATWDGLTEALLAYATKDGAVPVSGLPGLYHRSLSDGALGTRWEFWLNGRPRKLPVPGREGMALYPGELYIEYLGWPFGVIDCATGEGYAGAGDGANLGTFIAALQEASR